MIFFLRIILFVLPSFRIDMADWQAWAARLADSGPFNFYSGNFFADYFPFFYLFLFVLVKIFILFFGKAAIFSIKFEIYIKTISNIFDILTAIVIFKIIDRHSKKWAFLGSTLYLLNPSGIFNSSIWGQIDAIPTFFLIFSLYQLEEKKNVIKSLFVSVLSFLIKPLNIAVLPFMSYRVIKNFSAKKIFKALGISLLLYFAVTVPFFLNDPILGPFKHLFGSLDIYPYTSINAYNFWALFGWWKPDTTLLLNLSYHFWGFILYFIVLCVVFIPYFREKIKIGTEFDYFACAISSTGFFLFLTRIHERHLFPAFSLIIISACIFRSRKLIFAYILMSIINFINLFYSYYYYNIALNNQMASKNILFDIASKYQIFFSVFSIAIFIAMIVVYFTEMKGNLDKF
jgi:Gpi18-like mannosyltransferase